MMNSSGVTYWLQCGGTSRGVKPANERKLYAFNNKLFLDEFGKDVDFFSLKKIKAIIRYKAIPPELSR